MTQQKNTENNATVTKEKGMRKFGIFVLGMIFGIIFFLAALVGGGWIAINIVTPDMIMGGTGSSLGDFTNMSLMEIYNEIIAIYASKDINAPNAETGKYYSLADFAEEYSVNFDELFGYELPKEATDLPLFTLFTEGGYDKVLEATPISGVLSMVMGLTGGQPLSDEAIAKLQLVNLKSFIANPLSAISELKIGDLIAVSEDNALLFAFKDVVIGELIGADPLLAVAHIQLSQLLGDLQGPLAAIGGLTIGELTGSEFDMALGSLLNYQRTLVSSTELADFTQDIGTDIKYNPTTDKYIKLDGEDWYLAELACTTTHNSRLSQAHSADCFDFIWLDSNGNAPTGINKVLAGLYISDLTGDITSVLDSVYIGDLLGYTFHQDVWYTDASLTTEVSGITSTLVGKTIKDLTSGMDSILDTMYIGEIIGYTRQLKDTNCHTNDDLHIDDCYQWLNNGVVVTGITAILSNNTVSNLTSGLDGIMAEIYVGEVLGYTKNDSTQILACTDATIDHVHNNSCYEYTWLDANNTEVSGINAILANKTIDSLKNGFDEIMETMTLGEVMGYVKQLKSINCHTSDDLHTDDCYAWFSNGVLVTGINAKLADKTILQITNDPTSVISGITLRDALGDEAVASGILKSLADTPIDELSASIDNIYIGDALDYTKNPNPTCGNQHEHTEDCYTWYQDTGMTIPVSALNNKLANMTIGGLNSGLDTLLDELTIRDILGDEAVADGILKSIADTPIASINTAINDIYIGQVMNYYQDTDSQQLTCTNNVHMHDNSCYSYNWYVDESKTTPISGINEKLANKTVNSLSGGIDSILDDLTLRDVLGDDGVSSGILKSLADTQINELNSAINTLQLGNILGYSNKVIDNATIAANYTTDVISGIVKKDSSSNYAKMDMGVWYEATFKCLDSTHNNSNNHSEKCYRTVWYTEQTDGSLTSITGIMRELSVLTMDEVSNNSIFQSTVDDMMLGDLMTIDENSSALLFSLSNTRLGDLPYAMDNMLLGTMQGLHRRQISPDSTYTTVIPDIMSKDSTFIRLNEDKWYVAVLSCSVAIHTHTVDCYNYVWYKDAFCTSEVDTLSQKMSNLTSKTLNTQAITNIVATLTMGDMMECGILDLGNKTDTSSTAYKLDLIFNTNGTVPINPIVEWRDLSVGEFIDELVGLI